MCKDVLIGDPWADVGRSFASLDSFIGLVNCSLQSNLPVYLFNNVIIGLVLLDEVFEADLSFSCRGLGHVTKNLLLIRHEPSRRSRAHLQESLACTESGCTWGAACLASAIESCPDLQVSVTSDRLRSHGEGLLEVGRGDRWCVSLVPLGVGSTELSLFFAIHSFQTIETQKALLEKGIYLIDPKKMNKLRVTVIYLKKPFWDRNWIDSYYLGSPSVKVLNISFSSLTRSSVPRSLPTRCCHCKCYAWKTKGFDVITKVWFV